MPYHVLPDDARYYFEHDVSWLGCIGQVGMTLGGMILGIVTMDTLLSWMHFEVGDTEPGSNAAFTLLMLGVILGLSRAIKFVMLRRMGGAARLGLSTFSMEGFTVSRPVGRYMDVVAPDTYLTRAELTRITLIPHAMSLAVIAFLLPFVPPVFQFGVIFGSGAKVFDILVPLVNLGVALRCPPGSLFVESDGGVLDVYRAG